MHDLLPAATGRWDAVVAVFSDRFGRAGFGRVATPLVESTDVFRRVGEGTDIVSKEMYEFTDRDGSQVALRPESTAGVARAFIEHHPLTPWKVWYLSTHFRHERPQKGRLRQHHQLGAEVFGVGEPQLDVEVVATLCDFYAALGLRRLRLEVNDIGSSADRHRYVEMLRDVARRRSDDIDPEDRPKIERNALRLLDSKRPMTRAAMAEGVPSLAEVVDAGSTRRFEEVVAGLRDAGLDPVVNTRLVRGLDYYNGTVFEVVSEALDAAQSTIGAGGRYDGLVESMGGSPTAGFGFGAGLERLLLACDAEQCATFPVTPLDGFVVGFGEPSAAVTALVLELRRAGLRVDRSYDSRSPKAQMKAADRSGAGFALLIGDDERAAGTVTVRDLRGDGNQRSVARSALAAELLAARPSSAIDPVGVAPPGATPLTESPSS